MSNQGVPATPTRVASALREIQAVFDDQDRLDEAVDRLRLAGFDRAALSLPAPRLRPSEATPAAAAADPDTPIDRQQLRTLAGSTAGITAAMIGAGVTVATGGAAAVAAGIAVAAGAVVGGATHAATAAGTDAETATRDLDADKRTLVLAVAVPDDAREALASETLRTAGAIRIEPVTRTDATLDPS